MTAHRVTARRTMCGLAGLLTVWAGAQLAGAGSAGATAQHGAAAYAAAQHKTGWSGDARCPAAGAGSATAASAHHRLAGATCAVALTKPMPPAGGPLAKGPGSKDGPGADGPAASGPKAKGPGSKDGPGPEGPGPKDGPGTKGPGPKDGPGAKGPGPKDGPGTKDPAPKDGPGTKDGAGQGPSTHGPQSKAPSRTQDGLSTAGTKSASTKSAGTGYTISAPKQTLTRVASPRTEPLAGRVDAARSGIRASAPCSSSCAGPVVPSSAVFHDDQCSGSTGQRTGASYTVPATRGVLYWVNGTEVAAGTYPARDGSTVTVVVSARSGYRLTGITQWTHTFADAPTCSQVAQQPAADSDPTSGDAGEQPATVKRAADTSQSPALTGVDSLPLLVTALLLLLVGAGACVAGSRRRVAAAGPSVVGTGSADPAPADLTAGGAASDEAGLRPSRPNLSSAPNLSRMPDLSTRLGPEPDPERRDSS